MRIIFTLLFLCVSIFAQQPQAPTKPTPGIESETILPFTKAENESLDGFVLARQNMAKDEEYVKTMLVNADKLLRDAARLPVKNRAAAMLAAAEQRVSGLMLSEKLATDGKQFSADVESLAKAIRNRTQCPPCVLDDAAVQTRRFTRPAVTAQNPAK